MLRAITVTRCWAGVAARQLSGSAGVPANLELATPPEKEKLIVFDTSLRDGEQSPGVTLGLEQKCVKTKITTPPLPRLFSGYAMTICRVAVVSIILQCMVGWRVGLMYSNISVKTKVPTSW